MEERDRDKLVKERVREKSWKERIQDFLIPAIKKF
jgi:hypothetical protein